MLRDRFGTALKEAMKGGDKARVSAIRLVQAAMKDKDIELRGLGREPASDEEILSLLQKMVKQRQESLEIYEKNGRPELAATERSEIEIIASFMPRQMDEAEAAAAIEALVAELNASSIKDMGRVMNALKERHAGRMDFGKAGAVVKATLSGG